MNVAAILLACTAVAVAVMTSSVEADRCRPGVNCKLPSCRCWMDRSIPGNLKKFETPQIVLITFGNSVNRHTKINALKLMDGIKNPNQCNSTATFFIEALNSNPDEVKLLYDAGFEVALSTSNDTIPQTVSDWLDSIGRVKSGLINAGIPGKALRGFRTAQLYSGGDMAMEVFEQLGVAYDATCVNRQYMDIYNLLWPYTYDFPSYAPLCSIGKTPKKTHKGVWQFLNVVLTMEDKKGDTVKCPSPSSCAQYLNSEASVFEFLSTNFLKHYNGNRAPFNLYLDPLWLTNEVHFNGTRKFLSFLEAISDVWLLTFQQTLDWIRYPMDKEMVLKFPAWGCTHRQNALRNKLFARSTLQSHVKR